MSATKIVSGIYTIQTVNLSDQVDIISPTIMLAGNVSITPNILISNLTPTISSGFGTNASIVSNNGTLTFRANIGSGGVATSGTIGLPVAVNGWNAIVQTFNPTATNAMQVTLANASSNVSITLTNYWTANGAITAWPANTILMINATGY